MTSKGIPPRGAFLGTLRRGLDTARKTSQPFMLKQINIYGQGNAAEVVMSKPSCTGSSRAQSRISNSSSVVTRRRLIKGSAALAAMGAAGTIGWRGAIAADKKLVVTTMPGPRWEGALKASAKAYMGKHPDVTIDILVSPYAEHYQRIGTSLIEDSSDFDAHLFDPVLIG